ncbi:MAG TPA: TA system VapC family ribonuclease toxin [Thermoanaerobaculia bacterium]|nr:TA system VapC family ribonuclease toxin [Thermoanaerobaculia bacterium]
MILCDVNVLLYALVRQSDHHDICRRELERLRRNPREMAVSDLILAAVVRIATNPKVFRPAPSPEDVFGFTDALRAPPEVYRAAPGSRHWKIFQDLVRASDIRGADTTDAYLAALALEHGCEWWTTDSGFGRFSGLRWQNLIA